MYDLGADDQTALQQASIGYAAMGMDREEGGFLQLPYPQWKDLSGFYVHRFGQAQFENTSSWTGPDAR